MAFAQSNAMSNSAHDLPKLGVLCSSATLSTFALLSFVVLASREYKHARVKCSHEHR